MVWSIMPSHFQMPGSKTEGERRDTLKRIKVSGQLGRSVSYDEIKCGNIDCSLSEVNRDWHGTWVAVEILHHSLMLLGKVMLKQVLQTGTQSHWWQRHFSQHPTNCLFPGACHAMSPPTTFSGLKLSLTRSTDAWPDRHIVLESSASRRDWIPKCHLSLSSLLFLDLFLAWTFITIFF